MVETPPPLPAPASSSSGNRFRDWVFWGFGGFIALLVLGAIFGDDENMADCKTAIPEIERKLATLGGNCKLASKLVATNIATAAPANAMMDLADVINASSQRQTAALRRSAGLEAKMIERKSSCSATVRLEDGDVLAVGFFVNGYDDGSAELFGGINCLLLQSGGKDSAP